MLNRLYSETGAFDEIIFKPGLNIIMGRYSGTRKSPDINGIGKSSVVRLVNLAFLSSSAKKEFAHENQELNKQQALQKKLEKKLFEETGKNTKEFNHELIEIERRITELQECLEEYQFFSNYQDIERELIEIAKQIAEKNTLYSA